ncbi:MAG TPA: hypothetical protein VFS33_06685 [Gemmatimonadales bacterium]|nr:hypothetical protein [Gemmatimonadales bacterium]
MADPQTVRLLEELRDLARDQAARQERALALQEEALAQQRGAIETQRRSVEIQRRALRSLVPLVFVVGLIIIGPYVWNLAVALMAR